MSVSHPRGEVRFREREMGRIARAVRDAGGGKITLNPKTGTYTVEISSNAKADNAAVDEWDEALAK